MMDMDDPLDFEFEDQLISSSLVTKKRKKVIGLDDLLSDYYKEKSKVVEKEYKQVKNQKNYNSDEDVNTKEESLTKVINQCEHQMTEISGEEEMATWGIRVFGNQKVPPPLDFPELQSCALLQSFMKNELNSLLELTSENGNTFLEGLLANGWLYKLVSTCGHVQKSIATWTFNLMLYSSKEELRTSACDFWCSVLSSKNETLLIEWSPSYFELKGALEIYGFQFKLSSNIESSHANSNCGGPPQNIRTWIKFAAACCCVRVSRDLNCLRAVECISGVNTRSKQLRSAVSYQILLVCFDNKACDEEEILRLLISINVKEKGCDLFKMYIYLVLTENWLLVNQMLENNEEINAMWGLYLRNCSYQIASTDLRTYASKVRNKASYLLQGTINK
ncbi:hypothetical protein RGQ29_001417 [Quercus rubra]|uniref:Coiled-coil SMC6 And NSE5 INteracting (CANIN) domain-containing protein n=1 Tax=Quercus rubra TaxID=3512 RepID=A0AAN7GBD2_QUERU|nr:hypothetical protein RGQ29_001417 [Quercus rubra]KAK4607562.1 hypothetical protein RGQ29_001417 [Quercus rubra]